MPTDALKRALIVFDGGVTLVWSPPLAALPPGARSGDLGVVATTSPPAGTRPLLVSPCSLIPARRPMRQRVACNTPGDFPRVAEPVQLNTGGRPPSRASIHPRPCVVAFPLPACSPRAGYVACKATARLPAGGGPIAYATPAGPPIGPPIAGSRRYPCMCACRGSGLSGRPCAARPWLTSRLMLAARATRRRDKAICMNHAPWVDVAPGQCFT